MGRVTSDGLYQHSRLNTCGKVAGDRYRPYEDLANAIVKQAVRDWQDAYIDLYYGCRITKALRKVAECERFLLGEWVKMLTNVDGRYLLKLAKKQVIENEYTRFWYNPRFNKQLLTG